MRIALLGRWMFMVIGVIMTTLSGMRRLSLMQMGELGRGHFIRKVDKVKVDISDTAVGHRRFRIGGEDGFEMLGARMLV
jgi:hypothetical protein